MSFKNEDEMETFLEKKGKISNSQQSSSQNNGSNSSSGRNQMIQKNMSASGNFNYT